tara:strand:- start:6424 stop:6879 length:456 start_codon:yes stop_codon:yes gene_type:complete
MPQSLAKVYLHTIFSTRDRFPFFASAEHQREVAAYLASVTANLDCPAIKIGGVADHVHLLTELQRTISIAEFVKETKRVSSLWLKDRGDEWSQFHWQSGYGVFSVSESNVPRVKQYVANQAEQHRNQSFQDEFRAFLEKHGVEYDERYVWD